MKCSCALNTDNRDNKKYICSLGHLARYSIKDDTPVKKNNNGKVILFGLPIWYVGWFWLLFYFNIKN